MKTLIAKDIFKKAFVSYAEKYGISVVEVSILFVNVLEEIRIAEQEFDKQVLDNREIAKA